MSGNKPNAPKPQPKPAPATQQSKPQNPIDYYYDRERELFILNTFLQYGSISTIRFAEIFPDIERDILLRELAYLEGHGLLRSEYQETMGSFMSARIAPISTVTLTSEGVDFLKQDGGLGAILNVVTVKFHGDIMQLLAAYIATLEGVPLKEREKSLGRLQKLGEEGQKQLISKIVDYAFRLAPQPEKLLELINNLTF